MPTEPTLRKPRTCPWCGERFHPWLLEAGVLACTCCEECFAEVTEFDHCLPDDPSGGPHV